MSDKFKPVQSDYDFKKIYDTLELELIASMRRTLSSHTNDEDLEKFDWPQWQALKLKQMRQFREHNRGLIDECEKEVKKETYSLIRKQFKEGASKANKEAIKAGILDKEDAELGGSFFKINNRKIRALSDSVLNNLTDAHIATLRQANDIYRSTIYKATMMQGFGAKTLYQAIDMATNDFLTRGFKTIEYKDGSLHSTADYTDMAIRTATKRANLMGEGELRKRLGNPLVYVTKHGTSCGKCGKWQGRVYIDDVWSGGTEKDGKYPLLSTAIQGGLYHPRCRHGQSTYFEGINEEPEEIQENEHNQNDEYIQELKRREKQYERLLTGSLLTSNIRNYSTKVQELQNQIKDATMEELTESEQLAVNKYISSDFYVINEKLRNNLVLDDIEKELMNDLDLALDKMKNYQGRVRRSLELDDETLKEFLEKHRVGNTVKYEAYTATTTGERYNQFSNVELYIDSKRGKDIRQYNEEEQEILFKRGSKFKVKQAEKIKDVYYIRLEDINGKG